MPVSGELVLDFATYRHIVLETIGYRTIWILRGLDLLCLLGIVLSVTSGEWGMIPTLMVGGLVAALWLDVGVPLVGWRRERPLAGQPWRYELTDTALRITTSGTNVAVDWTGVSQARIRPKVWVYMLSTRGRLAVPRAAFTPDAQASIDGFVREFRMQSR